MSSKVIITAGGTSEKIDEVRKITNMATGKLGSEICNELVRQRGAEIGTIYYMCPSNAVQPAESQKIKLVHTDGTADVKEKMEGLLRNEKIDCVIHSMAVSDFTKDYVTSADMLAEDIADAIDNALDVSNLLRLGSSHLKFTVKEAIMNPKRTIDASSKISSHNGNLMLKLKQTPKVISVVKRLQPSTFLVGFKLLNGVSEEELFNVALRLLKDNSCDLVVANDLATIREGRHTAMIIEPDGTRHVFTGKSSIAENLVKMLRF